MQNILKMNCLGDSITYGYLDKEFYEKYCVDDWHPNQKFVKEILSIKIAEFVNKLKK